MLPQAAVASFACALLFAAPYFIYTLTAPFYADDWTYLYHFGQTPLTDLGAYFGAESHFFWRPLPKMLIRLQTVCFGLDPTGYHLVSIALHVVAIVSLGLFASLWVGWPIVTAIAVPLFATTWVIGDSVLWVSSQSALMAATLTWTTLSLWIVWLRLPDWRWARWSAMACLAAHFFVKETAPNVVFAMMVLSAAERPPWKRRGASWTPWRGAREFLAPLWPGFVMSAAFVLFYVFCLRDAALGERSGYAWASPMEWPMQAGRVLSHMLFSPIGDAPSITGRETSAIYAILAHVIPVAGPLAIVAVFWRRARHARSAAILTLVFFMPMMLLTVFNQGRYYYAPFGAFSLFLAALVIRCHNVSTWTWTDQRRLWTALAALFLIWYCGANWARLWSMAELDARRSQTYGELYTFLSDASDRVPEASVIVLDREGRPGHGLAELAKLATGRDDCEAVFNGPVDGVIYRRIAENARHAFLVQRDTSTGKLTLYPADKATMFRHDPAWGRTPKE